MLREIWIHSRCGELNAARSEAMNQEDRFGRRFLASTIPREQQEHVAVEPRVWTDDVPLHMQGFERSREPPHLAHRLVFLVLWQPEVPEMDLQNDPGEKQPQ